MSIFFLLNSSRIYFPFLSLPIAAAIPTSSPKFFKFIPVFTAHPPAENLISEKVSKVFHFGKLLIGFAKVSATAIPKLKTLFEERLKLF